MSIPFSSKPCILTLLEWTQIQNIKKEKKIMEIESLLVIQNSKENAIFNSIIKKLIRINIFDLSRISYLVILFLSPYIDPHLKELLNHDLDIPETILIRLYKNEKHDYLPPLDKTISKIIELVLNHLITMELFLNIHIFILYLNLHSNYCLDTSKSSSSTSSKSLNTNNIFLYKISNLIKTAKYNIPSATLSLLIMKIVNKLGSLNTNYFNDNSCITANLEKEYLDSKIIDIVKTAEIMNGLLDDFIIQIIKLCETNNDSSADNFIRIWNTSKNHIINIMRSGIGLFKIGLDILIIHLVKEQPDLESRASCICNSIINFLEMEIDTLDTKLNI